MERHTMHNFSLDKGSGAPKIITPAILGVAHSHGNKLPSNMTPDEKQQLLAKLEEWRKARREKLAASILAKQKQAVKSQIPGPSTSKSKPVSSEVSDAKVQEKPSVFERLYKNNCPTKKVEVLHSNKKPGPVLKPPMRRMTFASHEKTVNQNKMPVVNKDKSQLMHKTNEHKVVDEKEKPSSTQETTLTSNKNDCPNKEENANCANVETQVCSDPQSPNEPLENPETPSIESHVEIEPGELNETNNGTLDSESELQNETLVNSEVKTVEENLENETQSLGVIEPIVEETDNVAEDNTEEKKIEEEKVDNAKESGDCKKGYKEESKVEVKAFKAKVSLLPTKTWKPAQLKTIKPGPVKKDEESLRKVDKTKEKEKDRNKYPLLRRSISMMFRENRKTDVGIRRSMSTKSLKEVGLAKNKMGGRFTMNLPRYSQKPKKEKEVVSNKSVSFLTPKTNKFPSSTYLRDKLEDWLKTNGHSLDSYRHLRCFGIHNKDNGPDSSVIVSDFSDNSYYATAPNTPADESDKENVTPPTVLQQVHVEEAANWLKELHRLIVEVKYPSERCEEWLTAIRKKCPSCTQLPIYWECLAALDESKGDLKSAIEGYERAIIKGGEVDSVGESLAQLFDKMVLEQKKRSKPKLEKGIDPKNIFKSTIIKFALQQKALKKLSTELEPGVRQQLYVATPVRRSTRIHTPFKSRDVASLQTLTPDVLKSMTFKPNQSLIAED